MTPEQAIAKLNLLRKRAKDADTAVTTAHVHYDQAKADLESARIEAEAHNIDLDNLSDFEAWMDEEAEAIEEQLHDLEEHIGVMQEYFNGR